MNTRLLFVSCALSAVCALSSVAAKQPAPGRAASVQVKVVPVGTSQAQLDAAEKMVPQTRAFSDLLRAGHYRHLSTRALDSNDESGNTATTDSRFESRYYDYAGQRVVVAEGSLGKPASVTLRVEKNGQPGVSDEEFEDAVSVLRNDPIFGSALLSGGAAAYRPMPPAEGVDAQGRPGPIRLVNVGILPNPGGTGPAHEIVGVNLADGSVVRYPGGGPRETRAVNAMTCGVPTAHQATSRQGTAGQYQLTVIDTDGTVLWDMLVLRPAASSGTNSSGIEVRDVKYKGHSVMKRGHVPILNVLYVNGECGPYRDWQYQEGMFQTTGTDIVGAPGFRDCGTTPATTELETNNDTGNFRGVAVYREGNEVVLVTELEAGWYRYVHEWRFDLDGTIRPRFGFGAVANSCTCFSHTHHAYFRFDFDVDGPLNSLSELPLNAGEAGRGKARIVTEKKISRANTPAMYYRISGGKRSYLLYPGANDGVADTYAGGDMWFLHWHDGSTDFASEIDDGHDFFDPTQADLDQFLTGESLQRQDSVIWYHASFLHSPDNGADGKPGGGDGDILTGPEVVGPDLVPEGF